MKVFVTGPGGYIGGSVAARLVEAGHEVRGLVRSPETAESVRRFGIEPVRGSLDDAGLLAAEAEARGRGGQRGQQRPSRGGGSAGRGRSRARARR